MSVASDTCLTIGNIRCKSSTEPSHLGVLIASENTSLFFDGKSLAKIRSNPIDGCDDHDGKLSVWGDFFLIKEDTIEW